MRWGLRTKEVVAIVALTFVVVTSATIVHLAQLTRVVVENAAAQAELIAKQIYAQTGQSLAGAGRRPSRAEHVVARLRPAPGSRRQFGNLNPPVHVLVPVPRTALAVDRAVSVGGLNDQTRVAKVRPCGSRPAACR